MSIFPLFRLDSDIRKRRFVGGIFVLLILLLFFSLNRFPKLDTIEADLAVVASSASECFQGFCIENVERRPLLERWWGFSIEYLKNVSIGMLFAFVVAGITEAFLFPPNRGERFLGSGFRGVLKSVIIGPVVNLCSACIVPIANGFRRSGSGLETTVAITQSSSTMNLLALFMAAMAFAPTISITRISLSVLGSLLLGPIVAWVSRRSRHETADPLDGSTSGLIEVASVPDGVSWNESLSNASLQFVRATVGFLFRLGPIMVVAGFASGFIIQWISPDTITAWIGDDILGVLVAASIGILINVPLMFEIPLVAAMLLAGMGTAPAGAILFTAAAGGPITFWGLSKVMPRRGVITLACSTWAFGVTGGLALLFVTSLMEEERSFSFKADYTAESSQGSNTQVLEVETATLDGLISLAEGYKMKEIHPFLDATDSALNGPTEVWNPQPGVTIFDYDRDSDQDFYVTNGYGFGNWLYRNDGNGTFTQVGDIAGVSVRERNSTGVVACDINNDGFQDLYVGSQGSMLDRRDFRSSVEGEQNRDVLLLNNGDGTFSDITDSAFGDEVNIRSTMTVACSDVNSDGWLDIYVGNLAEDEYRKMHVPYQAGHFNMLYVNRGDLTFYELGEDTGIRGEQIRLRDSQEEPILYKDLETGEEYEGYDPAQKDATGQRVGDPTGQTHSVLFFDYDGDLDQDLWVANDGDRLQLYRNDSSESLIKFTSVSEEMGIDKLGAWMGFAVGDYDSDSDLDVFVTNIGFHPRLEKPSTVPQPDCSYFDQFEWGTCLHYLLNNNFAINSNVSSELSNNTFVDVAEEIDIIPSRLMPPPSLNLENIHPDQDSPRGLGAYEFGFGATFLDFDNDRDDDLYWLGSTVDRGEAPGGQIFPSAGRMMENIAPGLFRDVTIKSQLLDVSNARYHKLNEDDIYSDTSLHRISPMYHENGKSVVHGDINDDGYLDLIATNSKGALWEDERQASYIETGGPIFVWINPGGKNGWVKIRLVGRMSVDGTGSNADGIGSKVYVTVEDAETGEIHRQVQEIRAGSSYLSMDTVEAEFGVGNSKSIKAIEVYWTSGVYQKLENISINQSIEIVEPKEF